MTKEAMKLALEALTKNSDRVTEIRAKDQAITALKEALAAAQQEPVATLYGSLPVYETTTPARRKPLTDEEIDTLREANSEGRGAGWRFNFKGFARAIEAKIKENA